MKKTTLVLLLIIHFFNVFGQNPNPEFKKYNKNEFKEGMQFFVAPSPYFRYSTGFYKYRKKGPIRDIISLPDFKNKVLTFKRYETRKLAGFSEVKHTFLVFECDGVELIHDSNRSSDIIRGLIFYDDIIKAQTLYLGKKYLKKKNLESRNYKDLMFYDITSITPNNSHKAMQVTYVAEKSTIKNTKEFMLSGTNNDECISSPCYFENYFLTEKEYVNDVKMKEEKKRKEKALREEQKRKDEKKRKSEIKDNINVLKEMCHYTENGVDDFSNYLKVFTRNYILTGEKYSYNAELSISLRKVNDTKYIVFESEKDLGCSSSYERNQSFVKIKLENGALVTFYHRGDTDCGDFRLFGRLTQKDIIQLKKSQIKSIRLSGTDYYHDVTNVYWKTFFIDKLECIK